MRLRKTKKLLFLFLCAVMLLAAYPAAYAAEGETDDAETLAGEMTETTETSETLGETISVTGDDLSVPEETPTETDPAAEETVPETTDPALDPASDSVSEMILNVPQYLESASSSLTGEGTEISPYRICSEADLIALALGQNIENPYTSYYVLETDIELSSDTWTPIGAAESTAFNGVFDGQGHTISSTFLFQSTGMSGLFGINRGTIKNLNVDVEITEAVTDAGALCAQNYGTIENCFSSGKISATQNHYIGGLVGLNQGKLTQCGSSVTVDVPNTGTVGGLAGFSTTGSTVEYCYATGDVTGSTAGGLLGELYSDGTESSVHNCYAMGVVTGSSRGGGLIGYSHSSSIYRGPVSVTYCYAKGVVAAGNGGLLGAVGQNCIYKYNYYNITNTGNAYGFPVSITALKKQDTFYGWNFDNIWTVSSDKNGGFPTIDLRGEETITVAGSGTQLDPYIITDEAELFAIGAKKLENAMSSYYVLENDIVVTANFWTPIGLWGDFTGNFDGNGHTISGIQLCNIASYAEAGLFGYNSGTIQNLTVSGANLLGITYTGAVVAYNQSGGRVERCATTGSTLANVSEGYVGGLVGYNYGTISHCWVDCDVGSENSATVGGLVGINHDGTVEYSWSTGDVTGSRAGGLIGEQYSDKAGTEATATATVSNCYSMGKVTGDPAGGLIGYNHSSSIYRGPVSVTYCYSRGTIGSTGTSGGLIGLQEGNTIVRYCYYNQANTGNKIGFSVRAATLKDAATLYGWDFDNIWQIDKNINGGYPSIRDVTGETPAIVLEGSGDEDDPFLIHNEKELWALVLDAGKYNLSLTYHYRLENDIEVTANYWTPIGSNGVRDFYGTFDGNGYTISGIQLSNNYYSYAGLFGKNYGIIKNLNVVATLDGESYTGALAAANYGTIERCSSSGNVTSRGDGGYTGGLVGWNGDGGIITQSGSSATVGGTNETAGGLLGYNLHNGLVQYSWATGDVAGKNAGGLIGEQYSDGTEATVSNCYALGKAEGTNTAGGLIGYNHSASIYRGPVSVTYCYSIGKVSGSGTTGGLIGSQAGNTIVRYCYYNSYNTGNEIGFQVTSAEMTSQDTFYMWNFTNIWNISPDKNDGYPYIDIRGKVVEDELDGYGDEDDPYLIEDEEDLWLLVTNTSNVNLNSKYYYQLQNDIEITANYWTPIGGNGVPDFNGVFDGNGYTISGLRMSHNDYYNIGFIGVNTGTIKNLHVEVIFDGSNDVGGICANNSGTVENCSSTGLVMTDSSGTYSVGGLVGNNTGTISDSYSNATVDTIAAYAGGLVGMNDTGGTVTFCYATGNVTGKYAGGLIGNQYSDGTETTVSNCYALGKVEGTEGAGGLIGYSHSASIYRGPVSVTYCYSIGKVSGSGTKGGLIGILGSNATVTSSYYDTTLSEQTDENRGTPLISSLMKQQAQYVGWDFNQTWGITSALNGGYPYLLDLEPDQTVNVTGITLDTAEKTLQVGYSATLIATIQPSNALNKTIRWTSSDGNVAYVTNGTVTAKNPGTTTITAMSADGEFTATCLVTVTASPSQEVKVTGVTLNPTSLTMEQGQIRTLTATVTPDTATNKAVTWTSLNQAVATVDDNGSVTAVAPGTANILVTTVDQSFSAFCVVTVEETPVAVTGVTLDKSAIEIKVGNTETLTATVTPEDAADRTLTWTSSNTAVAEVVDGVVTGVGEGSATITVTTADGGFTATCVVTVTAAETSMRLTNLQLLVSGTQGILVSPVAYDGPVATENMTVFAAFYTAEGRMLTLWSGQMQSSLMISGTLPADYSMYQVFVLENETLHPLYKGSPIQVQE